MKQLTNFNRFGMTFRIAATLLLILCQFCFWQAGHAAATTTLTIASPTTAVSAANVSASAITVPIHAFTISADGTSGSGTLTNFTFTTIGTYTAAEIVNFKIWANTANNLGTAALLATNSSPAAAGAQTFTAFARIINFGTTQYFWITMDVASSVTNGHTIAVNGSVSTDMTTTMIKAGGPTNASGTRTLFDNIYLGGNNDGHASITYISDLNGTSTNDLNSQNTVILGDAYPNPIQVGSELTIPLTISNNKKPEIKIFNTMGQEVLNINTNNLVKGLNTVRISTKNLEAGIYFYSLKSGEGTTTKRFVLVK